MDRRHTWRPYDFEPVIYPGRELRLTYAFGGTGTVDAMVLYLNGTPHNFTVTDSGAEVVVSSTTLDSVPDRAPASVELTTGGRTFVVLDGNVVKAVR